MLKYEIFEDATLLLVYDPFFRHFWDDCKQHARFWPHVSCQPIASNRHRKIRKSVVTAKGSCSWAFRDADLLTKLEHLIISWCGTLWSRSPKQYKPWTWCSTFWSHHSWVRLRRLWPVSLLLHNLLMNLIILEALRHFIHHLNHGVQLFINILHI